VFGFGLQTNICELYIQNICSVEMDWRWTGDRLDRLEIDWRWTGVRLEIDWR